jgi:RNA polymerase sigma-70 factor (ECF subfamily)
MQPTIGPLSMKHETLREDFEFLLREHQRIVFKIAALYAGDAEDRRDLAQEICIQLWRSFPGYDPRRRFSTWMYRVALNVGISSLRQQQRHRLPLQPLDDEIAATVGIDDPTEDERMTALRAFIAGLAPLDRALILLYLDERETAEIADVLGISASNVTTKISRIKQRLRAGVTGTAVNSIGA